MSWLSPRRQEALAPILRGLNSGGWNLADPRTELDVRSPRKYLLRFQCNFAFLSRLYRPKAKLSLSQETSISSYNKQRQKEGVTDWGCLMAEEDIACVNRNHTCRENPGTGERWQQKPGPVA